MSGLSTIVPVFASVEAGSSIPTGRISRLESQWAGCSVADRLRVLRCFRGWLAGHAELVAGDSASGRGRPVEEVLLAEVLPLLEAIRFLERRGGRVLAGYRLGRWGRPWWLGGVTGWVERVPLGRVLVVGPSNYPLFLPGVQVLQALVAGNSVIWKPGRGGERVARTVLGGLEQSGLPPGWLEVTGEDVRAVGEAVERGIDKVVLTGSTETGRRVMRALSDRVTPSVMELGGCDAMVVRADADVGMVVSAVRFGLGLNDGATCMAPRRMIVVGGLVSRLEGLLGEAFRAVAPRVFTDLESERWRPMIEEALRGGARWICGSMEAGGRVTGPVILGGVPRGAGLFGYDGFGPVVGLVGVLDDVEAVAAVGECPMALGASIFSRDEAGAMRMASSLSVGVVVVNDLVVPTADPRVPFGGRGLSGHGVTRGAEGLLEMTAVRVVLKRAGVARVHFAGPGRLTARVLGAVVQAVHGAGLWMRWRGLCRLLPGGR